MDAIEIYNKLSRPPETALKKITGGKLSGKTDINPQWRYRAMTNTFGLVGVGWKYDLLRVWTENGAGGEVLCFAQVAVYVKQDASWSDPIVGIGGSKLVQLEKGQLVSNDEGYKMAVTDAFSTALKMIGVAAAIYEGLWDGTRYVNHTTQPPNSKQEAGSQPTQQPQKKAPNAAPTQKQQAASQGFTLKGGEATAAEREQLDELFHSKHADGTPIFTLQDIKNFSELRDRYTAKELIDIVYNGYTQKLAEGPKGVPEELF